MLVELQGDGEAAHALRPRRGTVGLADGQRGRLHRLVGRIVQVLEQLGLARRVVAREQAERSAHRLLEFREENATAPAGTTVWLGSSTIERFPLAQLMPNRTHLNRGIGGESAGELLDRLERSLPAARPARLVFYVGSIDHRVHGRPAARVAADARRVVEAALERWSQDPPAVTLLGILPEQDIMVAAAVLGYIADY